MTHPATPHPRPPGHLLVAVATISGLSMVLAVGLESLGFLGHLNEQVARIVSRGGAESFPRHLPDWTIWLAAASFAIGLAIAILGSPGHGRRVVLWITAMVLVSAWAPVLSLAAHAPAIAAPWVATLWSGICALVYAANHRMPCDDNSASSDDPR